MKLTISKEDYLKAIAEAHAEEGTVLAVIAVSAKNGRIVAGPDLLSRGLVVGNGTSALIQRAQAALKSRLEELAPEAIADNARLKDEVVRALSGYFYDSLGASPLVLPCVMEV